MIQNLSVTLGAGYETFEMTNATVHHGLFVWFVFVFVMAAIHGADSGAVL